MLFVNYISFITFKYRQIPLNHKRKLQNIIIINEYMCTYMSMYICACVLRMKIGLIIQIKIVSGVVIYTCNHGSQEAKAR